MSNISNLIKPSALSAAERKERARKAGIASGEARAKDKKFIIKLDKAINNAAKYTKMQIYKLFLDMK